MRPSLIRQQVLTLRRQLQSMQVKAHSEQVCDTLITHYVKGNRHIGLYSAINGEIDLQQVAAYCWSSNIACYLPVCHPYQKRSLWFAPFKPKQPCYRNRFGIIEPHYEIRLLSAPWELDCVMMPMVAFDNKGHRIGMGAGFYDSSFHWHRPSDGTLLVGCAHGFQQREDIEPQSWDVTLDAVVTEKGYINI